MSLLFNILSAYACITKLVVQKITGRDHSVPGKIKMHDGSYLPNDVPIKYQDDVVCLNARGGSSEHSVSATAAGLMRLKLVFQHLPEPNRACLVGVW